MEVTGGSGGESDNSLSRSCVEVVRSSDKRIQPDHKPGRSRDTMIEASCQLGLGY
jgi:hypothetical protein